MPRYYTRSQIGLRPPTKGGRIRLGRLAVRGIALHWPAMGKARLTTPEEVMAALRGWQKYHMDDQGWSDIGYQIAVDQAGNSYELRGHDHRSGANGNAALNLKYGALLLVLGTGEEPSPAMIATVRHEVRQHRKRYPRSTGIVGHGAIRPGGTQCPGPAVNRLIDTHRAFAPERAYYIEGKRIK